MTGRYLTDMADVLRAAGLSVEEEAGWQTRARSTGGYSGTRPYAVMWHHTASNSTPANDIAYMIRNSGDRPIANIYLARDGKVHVLAAGATNTNGKGGPLAFTKGTVPMDAMNVHAIGIEAANDGVGEVWPIPQIDAFFKTSIALAQAYGMHVTDLATHNLWAPTRKVDPAKAAVVQGPWKPAVANSYGTWLTSSIQSEATRRSIVIPPEPPPKPQPTPPPFTPGPPAPPPTDKDDNMVVALDSNHTCWIGDGMTRFEPTEAQFANYVVLGKAGAYRFVNTSGQQVSGWGNVATVGDDTIQALGRPI
jgi:hypothetical protein